MNRTVRMSLMNNGHRSTVYVTYVDELHKAKKEIVRVQAGGDGLDILDKLDAKALARIQRRIA